MLARAHTFGGETSREVANGKIAQVEAENDVPAATRLTELVVNLSLDGKSILRCELMRRV